MHCKFPMCYYIYIITIMHMLLDVVIKSIINRYTTRLIKYVFRKYLTSDATMKIHQIILIKSKMKMELVKNTFISSWDLKNSA